MKEFISAHLWVLALVVTLALRAWTMPVVRDSVFSLIPKLPTRLQWAAPLTLAMLAAAGQGWLDGKVGENLLIYSLSQGGQLGIMAIGFWHTYKRVRGADLKMLAAPAVMALAFSLNGCTQLPWAQSVYDHWRSACGKELSTRSDVAANARARGLDVDDFAEAICELSDVVAPFVPSGKSDARGASARGDEAVAAAKALGAMQ